MSISVEAIIRAAIERGEMENLPFKGERIPIEDESGIPPEDRMAYKVLRMADMVPPEVEAMRSLSELRKALADTEDPDLKKELRIKISQQEAGLRLKLERRR